MNNEDFITFADGNKITNKYIYMGGIFGTISKKSCVADLFYGTDYNSHLGTRRGGMATFCKEKGFVRSIHNLESSYFRTKFEPTLDRFEGATSGIGVISDTDAQPLIMNSLAMIMITTQAGILPRAIRQISAEQTSSLSASGSMNLPKSVIRLYFLAIFPSSISVRLARQNSTSAIHFPPGIPGTIKATRKNGIMIILSIVSLFGRFI